MKTNSIFDIQLGIGFSSLTFGSSMQDAEKIFGKPEEIILLDEIEDYQSTVWHYWNCGFSLFFDEKDKKKFSSVEINNAETLLLGQKLFSLTEKQIIELLQKTGVHQYEIEKEEWGEKRLTFDVLNVDFYFEKTQLVSVNYGKIIIIEPLLILSN